MRCCRGKVIVHIDGSWSSCVAMYSLGIQIVVDAAVAVAATAVRYRFRCRFPSFPLLWLLMITRRMIFHVFAQTRWICVFFSASGHLTSIRFLDTFRKQGKRVIKLLLRFKNFIDPEYFFSWIAYIDMFICIYTCVYVVNCFKIALPTCHLPYRNVFFDVWLDLNCCWILWCIHRIDSRTDVRPYANAGVFSNFLTVKMIYRIRWTGKYN